MGSIVQIGVDRCWMTVDDKPRYLLMESLEDSTAVSVYRDLVRDDLVAVKAGYRGVIPLAEEARKAGIEFHPNIANVYTLAVDRDRNYYLIMEYLPNGTLEDWRLRRRGLGEIAHVVNCLVSGLHHIHTVRKQIYKDMKPDNVAFDAFWQPKIIDFGTAEFFGRTGLVDGDTGYTPFYAAPEQRMGRPLDLRADIYCLAATIYSIFADDHFDVRSRADFLCASNGLLPLAPHLSGLLSERRAVLVTAVLRRAMAENPEARYASVLEFNREFQAALGA